MAKGVVLPIGEGSRERAVPTLNFLGCEVNILVDAWAFLSAKLLLCCTVLIVLFSEREYNFTEQMTVGLSELWAWGYCPMINTPLL